jgi:cytochrome P450
VLSRQWRLSLRGVPEKETSSAPENARIRQTNEISWRTRLVAIKRYLQQRLEHARAVGGQGLIAELVQVEKEGAPIGSEEMVVMVFVLLFAGHETTTHLISGSVFELAKNPGLRDWLAEDWSRADLAIEEFLRFVSPVQFSKPRFIRQDVELGGVRLKRGDQCGPAGGRQPGSGSKHASRKARS